MKRDLLIYVYGGGSDWSAICVDLDLAVTACSQREAMERIESTIVSYIEDALKEEPTTAKQLLSRSSPWYLRFKLWLLYQLFLFQRKRAHKRSVSTVAMACPA